MCYNGCGNKSQQEDTNMKKIAALILAMLLVFGCAAFAEGDEITLDVIICQYGPNTQE